MTSLKNENNSKSFNDNIEVTQPKRNADGKWPVDLTPKQVGMMTTEGAADYMSQLMLDTLNRATSKLNENTSS